MKSLLLAFLLGVSVRVNAATVELGKYIAVDVLTKSTVAKFELKANGTVIFAVSSPDFSVNCNGRYAVNGNQFSSNLVCNSFFLSHANVSIDISSVTPQNLRSAKGVEVGVIIDALGDDPIKYLLKKND